MPLLSARVGRPFGRAVENLPAIDMIALFEVVDWSEDRGEVALRGMNSDPRALFYKAPTEAATLASLRRPGTHQRASTIPGVLAISRGNSCKYNHRMSFAP